MAGMPNRKLDGGNTAMSTNTWCNFGRGVRTGILATSLFALAHSSAGAAVFTLDGIFDGAPPYSTSEVVSWYNGHRPAPDSIYGDENNQLGRTTIHYGVGTLAGGGADYFFLYVEAPLDAKNMIWQKLDWKNNYPLPNTDPLVGLTEADVASYRVHHETHHNPGDMKLDFKGATGSEVAIYNDATGDKVFEADLAGDATNAFGLVGYMDSVDYLLDNGICTEDLCLARDTPMSLEFQFALNSDQNNALLGHIRNGIEFHLSPERGLSVPVPATLPLMATALGVLGLFGWRRKRAAA
jgi:hypothetical protein